MSAEQLLEDMINDELERAKKLMPYWDHFIARLESAPQKSKWDGPEMMSESHE